MKTEELIERLREFENNYTSISNDEYIDDELINEVVKRLEGYDKLLKENKSLREEVGHWY